jgi:hypothetical protein
MSGSDVVNLEANGQPSASASPAPSLNGGHL